MIDPNFLHTLSREQLEIAIPKLERLLASARELHARTPPKRTKSIPFNRAILEQTMTDRPGMVERLGNLKRRSMRDRRIIALSAMLPTHQAVADAIGVHRSTVSRVLNATVPEKK
jgi:hypothetical protein